MDQKARTNEEVDPYIKKLPEEIQRIVLALREIILEYSPKRIEEYKWSMLNYSYNGFVCYIQPAKKHVNLGFHKGNELQEMEANDLLQGNGKTMRHIQMKKMEDIQPDILTSLIQTAVTLNEN